MTTTVQLGMVELVNGQDLAEIAVNNALVQIDTVIQLSVKDRDLSTPPGSPAEGDRYYVKPTGTGAWTGHDNEIAVYINGAWLFLVMREGWALWVDDEDQLFIWSGSAFTNLVPELQAQIYMSRLPNAAADLLTISAKGYWTYLGYQPPGKLLKFVEFHVTVAGVGTQTAEVGFFSTPSAPNKASQSLTKLAATGTVDSVLTTGMKRNTSAFNYTLLVPTHLWAGARFALTSTPTQPTITSLTHDMSQGHILENTTPGALTGAGPFTGNIPTLSTAATGLALRGTLV